MQAERALILLAVEVQGSCDKEDVLHKELNWRAYVLFLDIP